MAIEAPEGVQGLFLVLTGEKWPDVNEDALREVGNAWGTAGDRLENELAPYMLQVVQKIRANFTGKSAIKFADTMAPYVLDKPQYIPQAAAQFQQLKKFLLDAATQVEYVKIISIEELVLLIAQIAWAIAMAFWTDGASLTWLAARMAIVEFLLKTWWGRLILQFVIAELFGIAFQVALDVLTQAIQFAKHTRTRWDVKATVSAIEVGAVGGLLSLPFSAVSHLLSRKLTNKLTKILGREVDVTTLQPVVVRAVDGAARNLGRDTPLPQAAKSITDNLIRTADKPLRIRLTEIGVPAILSMTEEGLHEAITEGVVMAMNGQGFKFNPFSFTSGAASSIATQSGHGIGTLLAAPKPLAQGYAPLDDGDDNDDGGDDGENGDEERTPLLARNTSDTGSVDESASSADPDEHTTTAVATTATPPASSPSPSPNGGPSRNPAPESASSSSTTPPPVPPKDGPRTGRTAAVSANGLAPTRGSETAPPVPPKDTASHTAQTGTSASVPSGRDRTGTTASQSAAPSRSSGVTSGSSAQQGEGVQKAGSPVSSRNPFRDGSGSATGSSSGSPVSSRNPFREESRSATTPPSTTGGRRAAANGTGAAEANAGGNQHTGGRATANPSGSSRSQTRLPGQEQPPPSARPKPSGKGYGGDPMTFADLSEAAPRRFPGIGRTLGKGEGESTGGIRRLSESERVRWFAERRAWLAAPDGQVRARATEAFSGPGHRLGRNDGKGAGIPGLDNETRAKAKAERAKLGGPPARPVTPRTAPKAPVTLKDVRDAEAKGGEGTAAGATHGAHDTLRTRNGNGTMTVLDQPERVTEENATPTAEEPPTTKQEPPARESG
jgi:hypothetical protein